MKNILRNIELRVENRDGVCRAIAADDGKFYLVLTSETGYGNDKSFAGLTESTNQVEISEEAFVALANDASSHRTPPAENDPIPESTPSECP